jgi:hypothetical protein
MCERSGWSWLIATGALAAFVFVACRAPKIDPRTKNPCAYLTPAEAESVLGQDVQGGRLSFEGPFAVCTYRSRRDGSRFVELHLFRPDRADEKQRVAENLFEDELIAAHDHGLREIDSIGDRAFFVPSADRTPAQTGTLWVMRGETLIRVRAGEIAGHPDWKMAKELARCVMRRLP